MREFAAHAQPRGLVRAPRRRGGDGGDRSRGPEAVEAAAQAASPRRARKDSLRALAKLTETVDGELRFRSEPPLLVPVEDLRPGGDDARNVAETLHERARRLPRDASPADRQHLLDGYRFRHIARKVVGVGSVGTRAWVVLLIGADDGDPLFLQAKEAEASVLEPYAGASRYRNHGRRVVEGQRLMQAASDIFLGWCPAVGLDGRSATSTCASSGTGSARPRSSA